MINLNCFGLDDKLNAEIKNKITHLLENPFEGSGLNWNHPHPQARYFSNCHGTMRYIFGLQKLSRPKGLNEDMMSRIIEEYFMPSLYRFYIGSLVCFYEKTEEGEKYLIHTAISVNDCRDIFHQSGSGGKFEIVLLENKLNSLRNSFLPGLGTVSSDITIRYFNRNRRGFHR